MRTGSKSFHDAVRAGTLFQLADGSIQSCNKNAGEILGYSTESIIAFTPPKTPWQIIYKSGIPFPPNIHPAIAFGSSKSTMAALLGESSEAEIGFYRPDGSLIWLGLNSQPMFTLERQPFGVVTTFKDITITKSNFNDRQLQINSDFKVFANAVPAVIYIFNIISQRNIYINSQAQDVLGYTPEEITAMGEEFTTEVMHPEDLPLFSAHIEQLERSRFGETLKFEYRMRHRNGLWRWFCTYDRVYSRTADGRIEHILGIATDITNRQQTAISLQESEAKLKLATAAAGIGMFFWDIAGDRLECTEQGKAIFEVPPDAELSYTGFINKLHAEDRDRIEKAIREALNNKTEYSAEYRTIRSDGSIRWIAARGKGFYNHDGEPIRMMGTVQDITDAKQSQRTSEENEELLKLALSNAKAGTWNWDFIKHEIIWSPENYELYGIDPKIKPLQYQDWKNCIHPDDLEACSQAVRRVLKGLPERKVEFRIVHPQKGIRWLLGVGNVIRNSNGVPVRLSGINLDISDLEASKQALEQSERELKLITEVIPQQVWTALPNGKIDYINQRWQEYTGYSLTEIQKKGWSTIIHPEDLPLIKERWASAIALGQNYHAKARLKGKDGVYRWFLARARTLRDDKGNIIKWYGTNTAIHRLKELEDKLRQQTEDLTKANQLKDEFLAVVSHELRTPLNPILGWSQLLSSGRLDGEKTAMAIAIIEKNAKLQSQLIDDLLDVSQILRGKLNLNKIPLNLESVIRAAIATVQLTAEAKEIQIETEFEPNVRVLGDARRLQQVIWNLLVNAIKFTPEGGRVIVELAKIGKQASIQVRDTGEGIEANFLPYVFDRFRQAEGGSTRKFGGLGLGLAIVRHLSELHEGTVAVKSQGKEKGAEFSVFLPLLNTSTVEPEIESSVRLGQTNRFNQIEILVVDDETDSLDILTLILEQEGAKVTAVSSAMTALEVITKMTPDLIISDIGMPEMNGNALIERICNLKGKSIPAIALTAYTGEVDRQLALNAGFNEHLSKPIDIPQLIDTIEQLLGK